MEIWYHYFYKNIGVNRKDSNYLIKAENKWKDVYCNEYYSEIIKNNCDLHCYLFSLMSTKKSKFDFFKQYVHNMFFSQEQRNKNINIFCKTQKNYLTLVRFINYCKRQFASIKVQHDLNMNEIILDSNKSLKIYQNGAFYYFTLYDLINIFQSALTYTQHFFCEAYIPKNPYTNEQFTTGIMLQIYLALRRSYYKIPLLIEMFYQSGFNIEYFEMKYDYYIREEIIKNFIKNASEEENNEIISEILNEKCFRHINVADDFPKSILTQALKPCISFYLIGVYSLRSSHKQWKYYSIMKNSINKFFQENPAFGRKIIKLVPIFYLNRRGFTTKEIHHIDYKPIKIVGFKLNDFISKFVFNSYNNNTSSGDSSDDYDDDTDSVS